MERASRNVSGRAGINHDDKAEHALGKDLPHEIEALLARRAEQVQDQVFVHCDAAKIHGHRGRLLDGPLCL